MHNITIVNGLKLILAIMLFGCLIKLPFGYYQFVRFSAFIGFSILAYKSSLNYHNYQVIIYIALAMLFQPFLKVYLGRELWMVVDLIVGGALIISIYLKSIKLNNNGK